MASDLVSNFYARHRPEGMKHLGLRPSKHKKLRSSQNYNTARDDSAPQFTNCILRIPNHVDLLINNEIIKVAMSGIVFWTLGQKYWCWRHYCEFMKVNLKFITYDWSCFLKNGEQSSKWNSSTFHFGWSPRGQTTSYAFVQNVVQKHTVDT